MNKAFTAEAVVVCDVKLHRAAVDRLDLGFEVKSCNWCEAALSARINFIKVSTLLLLFSTGLFLCLTIKNILNRLWNPDITSESSY